MNGYLTNELCRLVQTAQAPRLVTAGHTLEYPTEATRRIHDERGAP